MKNLIKTILAGIILQASCNAQLNETFTNLDTEVYDEIKFHNVLFTDLKATNGDQEEMALLFPVENTENGTLVQSDPNSVIVDVFSHEIIDPFIEFTYQMGLEVFFSKETNDIDYEILDLKAENITIEGVTLTIGDPISNLTINYDITIGTENNKYIAFVRDGAYCCPIFISLTNNNLVEQIHYYEIP